MGKWCQGNFRHRWDPPKRRMPRLPSGERAVPSHQNDVAKGEIAIFLLGEIFCVNFAPGGVPPPPVPVDTTKTRSGPQRVRMSSGERPIGATKGKQSDNRGLVPNPPAPASRNTINGEGHVAGVATQAPLQSRGPARNPSTLLLPAEYSPGQVGYCQPPLSVSPAINCPTDGRTSGQNTRTQRPREGSSR